MLELKLVSASPRRKDLLEKEAFKFTVDTVKLSEIVEENLNIGDAIANLARTKAEAYLNEHKHLKSQEVLILTADTMVALGDQVLGKPATNIEAAKMLSSLSGKTHSVITGICLWNLKTDELFSTYDETKVQFKELSEQDIQNYVDSGEPMDKAGAYAIQGLGGEFVVKIEGSYDNVVGLPTELLKKVLHEKGWQVDRG